MILTCMTITKYQMSVFSHFKNVHVKLPQTDPYPETFCFDILLKNSSLALVMGKNFLLKVVLVRRKNKSLFA